MNKESEQEGLQRTQAGTQTASQRGLCDQTFGMPVLPMLFGPFLSSPTFDPNEWFYHFEQYASIYNWNEDTKRKVLVYLLQGGARLWYKHLQSITKPETFEGYDYNYFKEQLIKMYSPSKYYSIQRAMVTLDKTQQLPDELVQDYFFRIQCACKNVDPDIPEALIKYYFIRGLQKPIANKLDFSSHLSLVDVLEKAKRCEARFALFPPAEDMDSNDESNLFASRLNRLEDGINKLSEVVQVYAKRGQV